MLQKLPFVDVVKMGVLKNFEISARKNLWWSLFFIKIASFQPVTWLKKRQQWRCFPVNSTKLLKISFLQSISVRLLLVLQRLKKHSVGSYHSSSPPLHPLSLPKMLFCTTKIQSKWYKKPRCLQHLQSKFCGNISFYIRF